MIAQQQETPGNEQTAHLPKSEAGVDQEIVDPDHDHRGEAGLDEGGMVDVGRQEPSGGIRPSSQSLKEFERYVDPNVLSELPSQSRRQSAPAGTHFENTRGGPPAQGPCHYCLLERSGPFAAFPEPLEVQLSEVVRFGGVLTAAFGR